MSDLVRIELAQLEDAAALLNIHAAAVHQTAASYYTKEILNRWSPLPITSDRIERISRKWIENPNHRVAVAKWHNQVVGFGFIHINSELQALYVHPDFGRCGIGAKIISFLEQEAIALGLTHLKVDASINAENFYKRQGFEFIKQSVYRLNSGQEMACIKMCKTLVHVNSNC